MPILNCSPGRVLMASLVLCVAATSVQAKDTPTHAVATGMTAAAQKFLASLNADEKAKATLKFEDPLRRDWHNIPKPMRKGLQVRDMSPEQRELCNGLLRSALSETGYDKAQKIMSLENNLREGEKGRTGSPLRDPERYFLTLFGAPAATGAWGWSFEGHHFSLNFVIQDGQVVGDTPSFWGANPATLHVVVPGGPAAGTRTLANEEQLAFDLVKSLDDSQRQRAIIAAKAPDDYRAAGQPQPPQGPPEGIAAADLNEAQKKKLLALLEAYSANLRPELAAVRMTEIQDANIDRIHFAWAGSTEPGVGHYYRVQGPTFVLELCNIQSDPQGKPANHIHSVWRSLQHDFGVATK